MESTEEVYFIAGPVYDYPGCCKSHRRDRGQGRGGAGGGFVSGGLTDRDVATWGAFVCIRPRLGSRPFGAAIVRSGLSPIGLPRDKNVASDLSHI